RPAATRRRTKAHVPAHAQRRGSRGRTLAAGARLMRCAVVGGGAWGTALSDLLARAGHDVTVWAREPDVVEHINESHANPRFLAGVVLDRNVRASSDLCAAVRGAEIVVH